MLKSTEKNLNMSANCRQVPSCGKVWTNPFLDRKPVAEWYIKSEYTQLSDVYEKVIYSALCMLGIVNMVLLGILSVATSVTNFITLSLLIIE